MSAKLLSAAMLASFMIGQPLMPVLAQEGEGPEGPPPTQMSGPMNGEGPGMMQSGPGMTPNGPVVMPPGMPGEEGRPPEGMMPKKPNGPEPTCQSEVNRKRMEATRDSQAKFRKAMEELKLKLRSEMEAAKKIEDEDQRDAAIDAADDSFHDARAKLEKDQRESMRKLTLRHRADIKLCREKQKEQQNCLMASKKKLDEAMRAAQTAYRTALKEGLAAFEGARAKAKSLENEDERQALLDAADDAFFDARVKAEIAMRHARRAAEKAMREAKKTCKVPLPYPLPPVPTPTPVTPVPAPEQTTTTTQ